MDETSLSWGCAFVVLVLVIAAVLWFWPGGVRPRAAELAVLDTPVEEASPEELRRAVVALDERVAALERDLTAAAVRERIELVAILVLLLANVGTVAYLIGRRRALAERDGPTKPLPDRDLG